MFQVINNTISITKGDTGRIDLTLYNQDDTEYNLVEGDSIILSVRKDYNKPILFQINGPNFKITPDMTSSLAPGKYKYDIQFTSNLGEVSTVIGPSLFEILPEVTDEILLNKSDDTNSSEDNLDGGDEVDNEVISSS